MPELQELFEKQKANQGNISQTSAALRVAKLKKLRQAILSKQVELQKAIYDDFRKNPCEVDVTEVYPTVSEINHSIRHLHKWTKPHRVKTPLVLLGTRGEVRYEAKGVVLILSPWNYPFQLLMSPLVAAISAGNCVVLKPSSKTAHTARFLKKFISELFPENEIALVEGDHRVADALLELPFDHIFFTGSTSVGKKVMEKASKNLTSVTLELGGKSPVIIDETADIRKTAERVMWGKFINAGQTCVAPDYILIHESRQAEFIQEAKAVIASRYGSNGSQQESPDFCRLVTEDHLRGLKTVLENSLQAGAKIETGGQMDLKERFLSPTILSEVKSDSPIMKEEIFGPLLPILTFKNLQEAIDLIRSRPKPLALYVFSQKSDHVEAILQGTTAGGTCVNSLIIHLANSDLPFGGVGYSGMGNYHGFFGFKTFSHERAVLHQGRLDMLRLFYPPYRWRVRKMIQFVTRWLA